uniref:Uncharacterized protein n=1 Tax=Ciona intestinalis TaxID=7719 RepID=F6UFN6_CIOIN
MPGSPPGPRGLPILGMLPFMMSYPERLMADWSKKHGPVIMVKMGPKNVVILGSSDAAHAAFVKNTHLANRPQDGLEIFAGGKGILFINSSMFHSEQRRFCLSALREFGMGRRTLEPKIVDCAAMLCDQIDDVCGDDIEQMIYVTMSNVISHLVFGHDSLNDNKGLCELLLRTIEPNKYNALAGILMFLPSLKNVPPFSTTTRRAIEFREDLHRYIKMEIDRHRASRDPNQPRDFIDKFLNEIEKIKNNVKGEILIELKDQLIPLVRDLFMAGTDTSSTTITWAVIFLASFPDVQTRLHEELDSVLGQSRTPSVSMEDKMPYMRAVIQETFRMRPPLPLSVPHVAQCNTTLMGYRVPKDSIILTNTWGIQNNPKFWVDPDTFKPQRHIDDLGKFIKSPNVIPFNIGTRNCLGQQLAKMELFITIASLCRRFWFTLPTGETPDLKGESTFILRPFPFNVVATKRV